MVDIILSGDMQAGIELAKHAVEMNPGLKVIYSTARDGAQRHAHHLLDGNEDKGEPRPPNALKPSEKKYHATFVLSQYPNRAEDIQNYRERKNIGPIHARTLHILQWRSSMSAVARGAPVRGSKTCGGKTRWRQTAVDAREVLTGLFYVLWTGCQGAQGLPPKSTVH